MSIMDLVVSSLGNSKIKPEYIKLILSWVEQQGGISAIIEKFEQAGLSSLVKSWLSSGTNQDVNSEQLQHVFGEEHLNDLANKIGLPPQMATTLLSQALPMVVDLLTPDGQANQQNSLGLSMLTGKLFG